MKVNNLTRRVKSRMGIRDLNVNLIRLDKETIKRIMGLTTPTVVNYNLCLRIKNGEISRICESGTYVPMVITLQPNRTKRYSLRIRAEEKPKKPAQKSKTTTVGVISNAARNRQLWMECKKLAVKEKLVEQAIVFAKQVLWLNE